MFRELSEPVVAPGVMASLMELNIADSASMTGDARVQMAKDVKNVLRSMEADIPLGGGDISQAVYGGGFQEGSHHLHGWASIANIKSIT